MSAADELRDRLKRDVDGPVRFRADGVAYQRRRRNGRWTTHIVGVKHEDGTVEMFREKRRPFVRPAAETDYDGSESEDFIRVPLPRETRGAGGENKIG